VDTWVEEPWVDGPDAAGDGLERRYPTDRREHRRSV